MGAGKGQTEKKGGRLEETGRGPKRRFWWESPGRTSINELHTDSELALTTHRTSLSPVYSWGAVGSGAVCPQSGAESEGPELGFY